jgi:hypothetical protein
MPNDMSGFGSAFGAGAGAGSDDNDASNPIIDELD